MIASLKYEKVNVSILFSKELFWLSQKMWNFCDTICIRKFMFGGKRLRSGLQSLHHGHYYIHLFSLSRAANHVIDQRQNIALPPYRATVLNTVVQIVWIKPLILHVKSKSYLLNRCRHYKQQSCIVVHTKHLPDISLSWCVFVTVRSLGRNMSS